MIQSTHSYHLWVRNIIPNDYSFCYIMHSHSVHCNLLYFEVICCLNFSNYVVIFAPPSLKCQNHTVTPIKIIEYYLMKIFAESFFFFLILLSYLQLVANVRTPRNGEPLVNGTYIAKVNEQVIELT